MVELNPNILLTGTMPNFAKTYYDNYDAGRKEAAENAQARQANALAQAKLNKPQGVSWSQHLGQQGFVDEGLAMDKAQSDVGKAQASFNKEQVESHIKDLEIGGQVLQGFLQVPQGGLNKAYIDQQIRGMASQGILRPDHVKNYEESIANLPDDDAALRNFIAQRQAQGVSAKEKLQQEITMRGQDITMRGQDISANTQMRGQDITQQHNIASEGIDRGRLDIDAGYKSGQLDIDRQRLGLDERKRADALTPQMKLSETQKKQVIGVQNTRNAITEYRDQLKNFGLTDLASPDARALMGVKYNNMMLQAKEAYNLGVLNGPDLTILQSVITDPRSLKGAITSKEALDTQAKELDRIMQQIQQVSSGNLSAPRANGLDETHVQTQAQKLGTDPEKVKAFLAWKAGRQ